MTHLHTSPDLVTVTEDFEEITSVRRISNRPKKLDVNQESLQCLHCRELLRVLTIADLDNPLNERLSSAVVAYICVNPLCLEESLYS